MAKEKAIVLSTHILEEVDAMCTRIIVIANGKVIVDSTPTAIREKHPGKSLEDIFCDLTQSPN